MSGLNTWKVDISTIAVRNCVAASLIILGLTQSLAWACGATSIEIQSPSDNQKFCFTDATSGTLSVPSCLAIVVPSSRESSVQWSFSASNGTTVSWSPSNARGQQVALLLSGLPTDNSGFGGHAIVAEVDTMSDSVSVQLFYPSIGASLPTNHPGPDQGLTPNWYYYYLQTEAGVTGVGYDGTSDVNKGGYFRWEPFLGYVARYDKGGNMPMNSRTVWGSPAWIDAFAWIGRHEVRHIAQITSFWGNQDRVPYLDIDNDYLPDIQEWNIGRGYSPFTRTTYPDDIGYGENPIIDTEDLNMRVDEWPCDSAIQLWQNGQHTLDDWAHAGQQWTQWP